MVSVGIPVGVDHECWSARLVGQISGEDLLYVLQPALTGRTGGVAAGTPTPSARCPCSVTWPPSASRVLRIGWRRPSPAALDTEASTAVTGAPRGGGGTHLATRDGAVRLGRRARPPRRQSRRDAEVPASDELRRQGRANGAGRRAAGRGRAQDLTGREIGRTASGGDLTVSVGVYAGRHVPELPTIGCVMLRSVSDIRG